MTCSSQYCLSINAPRFAQLRSFRARLLGCLLAALSPFPASAKTVQDTTDVAVSLPVSKSRGVVLSEGVPFVGGYDGENFFRFSPPRWKNTVWNIVSGVVDETAFSVEADSPRAAEVPDIGIPNFSFRVGGLEGDRLSRGNAILSNRGNLQAIPIRRPVLGENAVELLTDAADSLWEIGSSPDGSWPADAKKPTSNLMTVLQPAVDSGILVVEWGEFVFFVDANDSERPRVVLENLNPGTRGPNVEEIEIVPRFFFRIADDPRVYLLAERNSSWELFGWAIYDVRAGESVLETYPRAYWDRTKK